MLLNGQIGVCGDEGDSIFFDRGGTLYRIGRRGKNEVKIGSLVNVQKERLRCGRSQDLKLLATFHRYRPSEHPV
jgi:hypothetical protein